MFSCEKETTEPQEEVILSTDPIDQLPTVVTVFKHLIFESLFNVMTTPALHGLQGEQGDTRDGCVDSVLSPPTGFPTTLIQTYTSPSGSCGGSVIRPDIIGELSILLNAPVLSPNTGLDDILISIIEPVTINGYKVEILGAGEVQLNYTQAGGDPRYRYYLPEEGVRVTDCSGGPTDGYITTLLGEGLGSGAQIGEIRTVDGAIPDDSNNPLSYIDNVFDIRIFDASVTCQNSATGPVHDLCVDTSENLEFQPVSCGCITDGELRVRESACSDGNVTNANAIQYNFGDAPGAPGSAACDNVVGSLDQTGPTDVNTFLSIPSCDPL